VRIWPQFRLWGALLLKRSNTSLHLKSKTCIGSADVFPKLVSFIHTTLRMEGYESAAGEKRVCNICWIINNSATHWPILLKFGIAGSSLVVVGREIVRPKVYFSSNPRWRVAPQSWKWLNRTLRWDFEMKQNV